MPGLIIKLISFKKNEFKLPIDQQIIDVQ